MDNKICVQNRLLGLVLPDGSDILDEIAYMF